MFELDCDSQLNNSPLPTVWSSNEWNVFAIGLLLNGQPCRTWGFCVQSSMVGQTFAHSFGSFVWYSARHIWHDKFWTVLLVHQTVSSGDLSTQSALVMSQIIFQTQLTLYKLDTSIICCSVMVSTSDVSRKHIGDMANLAARRHGWWEGTTELLKHPFFRVVAVSCGNGTRVVKESNFWMVTVRYFAMLEENV